MSEDSKAKNSFERIYEIVRQIPRGTVATYGQVAALAGNRRWSRVVGYALHVNPDPDGIPCKNGKVDLEKYQWKKIVL